MNNRLSFEISSSSESNDHQIRILIDEEDLVGEDYLGLDPPDFFRQKNLLKGGELIVGRCTCGVRECCDYSIQNSILEHNVSWLAEYPFDEREISFSRNEYFNVVQKAAIDFSWEDHNRKAERLVSAIFEKQGVEHNETFDWASARIKQNIITLSFTDNFDQTLYEVEWDGTSPNNAVSNVKGYLGKGLISHVKT